MGLSEGVVRPGQSPSECPVCGEAVPPRARACPHCGADERTGWDAEATRYDGLDLPDSAFEDDDAAPRRAPRRRTATGIPLVTWWIAAGLLVFVTLMVLRGRW